LQNLASCGLRWWQNAHIRSPKYAARAAKVQWGGHGEPMRVFYAANGRVARPRETAGTCLRGRVSRRSGVGISFGIEKGDSVTMGGRHEYIGRAINVADSRAGGCDTRRVSVARDARVADGRRLFGSAGRTSTDHRSPLATRSMQRTRRCHAAVPRRVAVAHSTDSDGVSTRRPCGRCAGSGTCSCARWPPVVPGPAARRSVRPRTAVHRRCDEGHAPTGKQRPG